MAETKDMWAIRDTVDVAEIYYGRTYAMLRNDKTARVVDATKRNRRVRLTSRVREFPDFPALLAGVEDVFVGATVIVTLGDSTTTNHQGWPRKLAWHSTFARTRVVVVNLACWATVLLQHVRILESFLGWLSSRRPAKVCVVLFGGVGEVFECRESYNKFMRGERWSPLTTNELEMLEQKHGREIERLSHKVPALDDKDEIDRWVARRVFAGFELLEQVCLDGGVQCFSVLQPLCYPDFVPGYYGALRRVYDDDKDRAEGIPLELWCRERRARPDSLDQWGRRRCYFLNPGDTRNQDFRPIFDSLIRLWGRPVRTAKGATHLDFSALFAHLDRPCYTGDFDAVHYDGPGQWFIAGALAGVLPIQFSAVGRVLRDGMDQIARASHRDFNYAAEALHMGPASRF